MKHSTSWIRALAAGAAAVVTAGALAGCGQQQGATTLDPEADVKLVWWTGQDAEANDMLKGLAQEFEEAHPNVDIEVSPGASSTDELLTKLSAGFAGGTYPDISYAYGSWASQLESSGRTLDITEQVSDPALKWDEFPESARLTVRPTGNKTIGFPAIVDNLSLIYNTELFDAAGLAYPDENWSWDDFRAAAKALTDPSKNQYGYAYSVSGQEETTWQFWPHLWQNGGAILSDDGTEATFNSQAGVDALTFLRDMAQDDKSIYLDQTDTKFGELFAAGSIGMITSGPWQLYDLNVAGTPYGVTILPGTNGDHQTVSGPDIWALFDHQDKNREYWAFEFTNWLTSAEQDQRWNVAIGNLPLRTGELDSDAFAEQVENYPYLDVMAANGENAKQARPTVAGYNGLSVAIGDAISHVLQGDGDPKEALDAAAAEATEALNE
ncbi:MAG: ABC transporter substrate-binding protein [Microbacteriaceae bacterium]|nr:ABC transporter substrate-binding protein [Microbacteriaceae bacterium]